MRIEGPPPVQTSVPRREVRGTATDRNFANTVTTEPPPTAASASPLTAIEGLFALQEISDELTGRRRAAARGNALLDRLDDLRVALLAGKLPRAQLVQLRDLAREHGPAIDDPKLAGILGEIELRVAVELAKLDTLA
jgi:Class II flagellar assembly regulator